MGDEAQDVQQHPRRQVAQAAGGGLAATVLIMSCTAACGAGMCREQERSSGGLEALPPVAVCLRAPAATARHKLHPAQRHLASWITQHLHCPAAGRTQQHAACSKAACSPLADFQQPAVIGSADVAAGRGQAQGSRALGAVQVKWIQHRQHPLPLRRLQERRHGGVAPGAGAVACPPQPFQNHNGGTARVPRSLQWLAMRHASRVALRL